MILDLLGGEFAINFFSAVSHVSFSNFLKKKCIQSEWEKETGSVSDILHSDWNSDEWLFPLPINLHKLNCLFFIALKFNNKKAEKFNRSDKYIEIVLNDKWHTHTRIQFINVIIEHWT